MAWASEAEDDILPEKSTPTEGMGWASEQKPVEAPAATGWASEQKQDTSGWASEQKPPDLPMPGAMEAIWQGLKGGWTDVGQTSEAFAKGKPTAQGETSPAAEPYELIDKDSWWPGRDVTEPGRFFSKTGYRLGKSWPTLGMGVVGGGLGAAAGAPIGGVGAVPGGIIGGSLGAAGGAALQTLGPVFGEELKKTPDDPEGAWTRAMEHAAISGAASGVSWAAFPLKVLNGPIKNLAFQAFGLQPAIGVAEKAAQNVVSDKPITEGMKDAITESMVGTLVPAIGHKALEGTKAVVAPPVDPAKAQLLQSADYKLNLAEQTRQLAQQATNTTDAFRLGKQANLLEEEGRFERFLGNSPEDSYQTKTPAGKVIDSYIGNFQPDLFSDKALVADAKTARNRSEYAQAQDAIMKSSDERRYDWNKISEPDRTTFMEAYEIDPTRWSPNLQMRYADLVNRHPNVPGDANLLRKWLFDSYMSEKEAGSRAEYIINYLPHQFKKPVQVQQFFANQMSPQGVGPTWFQKARFYDTVELARQAGFELATTNPFDLVTNRLLSGADMRAKMNWLNEAYDMGLAVPKTQAPNYLMGSFRAAIPWMEVSAPNGTKWMLAPDAQALWTNGIDKTKSLWARPDLIGDSYRGWMALKSAWVPIKLGLSMFHPVHVAHINMTNNISRALNETFGKGTPGVWNRVKALPEAAVQSVTDLALAYPIGIPWTKYKLPASSHLGKQVRENWFVPLEKQTPQQRYTTDLMNEAGVSPQLSEQLRTSGERQFKDAIQTGDWKGATVGTLSQPLPALRLAIGGLSKPIFEQWIPNLKAAAVIREAESMARRFPDIAGDPNKRAVAMRAIGKQVDNRFGEMFYGSLFWNKTIKEASIGSFLSLGWNLGFVRDLVAGALAPTARRFMDNPTPNRQAIRDVTNKGTNLFMYVMSAMIINAIMNKGLSGENPEGWDYIFPRIGGLNPDGSPRRITNAFYTREVPMAMKHIDEAQSIKIGLAEMLKNKLMFAPFIEMFTNHNYFGNQIWDENAGWWTQWGQLGKNVLTEQLNPMSISGAKRALQLSGKPHDFADVIKQATDRDVVMPLLGFGPAPTYVSRGPIENRIAFLARKYAFPSEKPYREAEKMKERGDATIAYKQAVQAKDEKAISHWASKLAELGMPTDRIRKIQPGGEIKNMFQRIGTVAPSQQIDLLKRMSPEQFRFYYPAAAKNVKWDKDIQALVQRYYQ